MKPRITILFQALRHTAVGVAVLAVLLMSFSIHLHSAGTADTGDGGSPVAEWVVLGDVFAEPTDPTEPSSPDQDLEDACDCPSPAVSAPHGMAIRLFTSVSTLVRLTHSTIAPESVSYPPDPPPARLS